MKNIVFRRTISTCSIGSYEVQKHDRKNNKIKERIMQGIMFNERVGMESATLDGSKTRTTRNELDRKKKHTEEEWEFINLLYDDNYMKHSGALEFDGVNTFTIKDSYNSCDFKTRYKVGKTLAIKQSYDNIFDKMDSERYNYDQYEDYRQLAMGMKLAGNTNKMFVRNDLMPHHIQITDIKLERLQEISEEDCLKEGIKKTMAWTTTPSYDYGAYPNEKSYSSAKDSFSHLIDNVSGKGTWGLNNWNVVYYYKLID